MLDPLIDLLNAAITSPWVYLALFAASAIDGFLPAVPSESLVITAGVFAASGAPNAWLVMLVAAVGAFMGDHISYAIGAGAGGRLIDRLPPGSRKRKPFDWARKNLAERGGLVLVICRYIPGFRTATTLTMGAVRYPLRRFMLFDAIAAVSWAVYSTVIGYIGGHAFEDNPLIGLAVGLGIALSVTLIVEGVRYWNVRRRSSATVPAEVAPESEPLVSTTGERGD